MKDPRESSLSFKNIFKRETKLAAYIIACMTVVVMSISYALFFQVDNNTENQIVEAGDLKFTYSNGNTITSASGKEICFQPMSEEEANLYWEECSYSFSVKNTGTLKANYSIKLVSLEGNEVIGNKLKVILKKKGENGVLQLEEGFPKSMTGASTEPSESEAVEKVELELLTNAELNRKDTIEYRIQIYVDEKEFEDTDVGKNLKYEIQGTGIVHDEQPNSSVVPEEIVVPFPDVIADEFDDQGNGLVTQSHEDEMSNLDDAIVLEAGFEKAELRYIGPSPNNYIWFNCDEGQTSGESCELWRIIGLVNVKTTSGITQRIKIIKDEKIGEYSWDTSFENINGGYGINEWSQADVMKLLNPGYEDNNELFPGRLETEPILINNSLYWNKTSGNCTNMYKNQFIRCSFDENGMKKVNEKYIAEDIIWNTGSNGNIDYKLETKGFSKNFYQYERSTYNGKICTPDEETYICNDDVERTTTWQTEGNKKALVGLMYPSDYGYAVGGDSRTTCLEMHLSGWNNEESKCFTNNWLYKSDEYQSTITPYADSKYANDIFIIRAFGHVDGASNDIASSIHPVIYLKENVEVTEGTTQANGSKENPYSLILQE